MEHPNLSASRRCHVDRDVDRCAARVLVRDKLRFGERSHNSGWSCGEYIEASESQLFPGLQETVTHVSVSLAAALSALG